MNARMDRPRAAGVLVAGLTAVLLATITPPVEAAKPGYPRTISFAGRQWSVKSSAGAVGPGPNHFSDSSQNVWVDSQGLLHMKIRYANGRWYCSEVILKQSLGHGTYSFALASRVDALDRNVVLGLFTWSDQARYAHREMDVEFARWGNASDATNAQYVVQPYDQPNHLLRWTQPAIAGTIHSFTWGSQAVAFQSATGTGFPSPPTSVYQAWTYGGPVPVPRTETTRMNLWLFSGQPPSDGTEVEVVITDFRFTPA